MVFLSGKNPSFLANTFSTSEIINEVKKVKLLSHKGFSLSVRATTPQEYRVAKKIELTHKLGSNVDALAQPLVEKRLAVGYRRGKELPVRWGDTALRGFPALKQVSSGSPTCSRSVSPWEKQLARHGETAL
ncbi:hypothetical protein [Nostoc sp.]|uniref:hypothetical protein n=1 Tax=Nostoc sp. TaxID=1180 RepID=UPI002FF5897F